MQVILLAPDGPGISTEQDVLDALGWAYFEQPGLIAIPVEVLDVRFFDLSTRLAGDLLQKLVNYRPRVATLGDIAEHVAASPALRDFVSESNRGRQVWFLADLAELDGRLAQLAARDLSPGR
ncbi:DUF4180 domain-containing protein [Amycolatopsis sp. H20-H5]|uniref:DUF4180 domain-containing protein n=1 Tax=Amycolatopsis sp. H20-H5 TaxID=3046309 RepID=UPI002DB804DD|nr:DUF4180 domain-containing protein [Amycolatopsis sp. H20-H5]MEC3979225.1 DUF4180 domain-containing protein [Amycolatopsis sp. H20-H5]